MADDPASPRGCRRRSPCSPLLAGCATPEVAALRADAAGLPPRAEVAGVPFHPQQEQYCGPAALATVLGLVRAAGAPGGARARGVHARPRRHARPRPGRRRAAVTAASPCRSRDLPSLLARAGRRPPGAGAAEPRSRLVPAVALCRRGRLRPDAGELALRSGEERRQVVSLDTFARTWARADRWALVVLPPDALPANAAEAAVLSAASGLERAGRLDEAALAYDAILRRWPDSLEALIGRGNARYAARRPGRSGGRLSRGARASSRRCRGLEQSGRRAGGARAHGRRR